MNYNVKSLIGKMTLEEKAGMCSGKDFWHLKGVEHLGIPSVMVSDGPHGLRKQDEGGDHLGINDSIKAVCFPAASALACSFDRDLMYTVGEALGEECQAENVSVLLGPAINIKRSPLCGRNFEYFSEDPYLTGHMAAAQVNGLQSKNVGSSLKHFAVNNQEHNRMTISAEVDERTMREIYLNAFEIVVRNASPWTIMSSYNKINGTFAGENKHLLTDILRNEWGFNGYVVSDWCAVNNRVDALKAGLDLEMPSSKGITDRQIIQAIKNGDLDEEVLNCAVERILNIIYKYWDNRIDVPFKREEHHHLAVHAAEQSAVLLKNDSILPLKEDIKVAFVGGFAKKPRFQGGGSSHINAFKVISALDAIKTKNIQEILYSQGFEADGSSDEKMFEDAIAVAKGADCAVIFAGLPDSFESEGYDRSKLHLPEEQNRLIDAISDIQPNTIVILHGGSPVTMPWKNKVKAILQMYLGGQGVGEAAINILYGRVNPSGKLAETFPIKLEDTPCYLSFPGDGDKVHYNEGIFIGYRYYDIKNIDTLFPFGHGLSYTTFEYSNLHFDRKELLENDLMKVYVDVTNTGKRAGSEAVQLYISNKNVTNILHPIKELKGFDKLYLESGETKRAEFLLDIRSFSHYSEKYSDWRAEPGEYEISIAASSADIRLIDTVMLKTSLEKPKKIDQNTRMGEIFADERLIPVTEKFTAGMAKMQNAGISENEAVGDKMIEHMMAEAPLRILRYFAGMDQETMDGFIAAMNMLLKE